MAKQKKKSNKLLYWGIGIIIFLLIIFLIIGKSQGWIGKSKDLEVEFTKSKRNKLITKPSSPYP